MRPLTFTLICVLGIALLKYVIHISTGVDSPLILFYSAVILCSWYGGFTQGLLASALSMALAYTVFTPYPVHTALDLAGKFFLFLIDSTIVALMAARLRELKIVAERNLEIEKRESKDYLDSVIDNLPNMLFIKEAKSLRFVRFNKAGEDLIGISRENMLGKNDFDIFPSEQAAFFTENDRAVLTGGKMIDIPEEPLTTRSGLRYLHTKKIPILNAAGEAEYLLGISEDITERKQMEEQKVILVKEQAARLEAEKSAEHWRLLFESSRTINVSLDSKYMLKDFAASLTERFADWCVVELDGEDSKGPEAPVLSHRDPERVKWGIEYLKAKACPWPETVGEDESGLMNDLNIPDWDIHSGIMAPVRAYGKKIGILRLARTGHDREFTQFDLALAIDLGERLGLAVANSRLFAKAQEASRAKSSFLANMSHEIRTPLSAMLGFADLMGEEPLSKLQQGYLQTITRNGRQLLRIVDEILDLSKVESERIVIEKVEFSLPQLIDDVTSLLKVQAQSKGLEFRVNLITGLPARIVSDPTRIRQILINIIGNAIKFTSHGSIDIEISSKDLNLEFRITDTGIGIPDEQRQKLFQPFVQADSSTTRRFGGTGLGLFVSRRLAKLLKGDVQLIDRPTELGSQFLVTLRFDPPSRLRRNVPEFSDEVPSVPLHGHILVADDSDDNRILLEHYLQMMNFKVDLATDGKSAVEMALSHDYDAVLMDVQMPEMDGFEAMHELRAKQYPKPVIAVTAHAMKGDKEHCLEEGFDDYLAKPIERETLRRTLAKYSANYH